MKHLHRTGTLDNRQVNSAHSIQGLIKEKIQLAFLYQRLLLNICINIQSLQARLLYYIQRGIHFFKKFNDEDCLTTNSAFQQLAALLLIWQLSLHFTFNSQTGGKKAYWLVFGEFLVLPYLFDGDFFLLLVLLPHLCCYFA